MTINGNVIDTETVRLVGGFDGTVAIGGTDLVFPDYCSAVLVVDNGAGLEIWYEETPVPHIFWAGTFMCLLGATVFILRLVQKVKST